MIFAIDPGTTESAWVQFVDGRPRRFGKDLNVVVLREVDESRGHGNDLVIEWVQSFGMPVGAEVFETCYWAGRFAEAFAPHEAHRLKRTTIKGHICGSARAKDANVRAALIERFGPTKAEAVGTKKKPGPLYGIKGDVWSALAVAMTFADAERRQPAGGL